MSPVPNAWRRTRAMLVATTLAINAGVPAVARSDQDAASAVGSSARPPVSTGRSGALAEIFAAEAPLARPGSTSLPSRNEIWRSLAGHPAPSPDVLIAIATAAARTGVDLGLLLAAAWKESTFRPSASAPNSSARGLFQFTEQTWRESLDRYGSRHGIPTSSAGGQGARALMNLRHDPMAAALIAAESIRSDGESLAAALGRSITQSEAFLAHFLGRSGAERFLRAVRATPNRDVREIIPTAFANNRARFPRTSGPITVRDAHAHLIAMLESRRTLYLQLLRLELLMIARRPDPVELAADETRPASATTR